MRKRFDDANQDNRTAYVAAMSLSFVFLPTVEFLAVLATAIVLWFGGRAVAQGALEIGVLVAFLAYVTRFFQPIQELSQLYTTMQSAMAGGERVLELLDARPEVADPPDGKEMPTIEGRIELRGVNFSYGSDDPVLHDVDLVIEAGADGRSCRAYRRGQVDNRQFGGTLLRCEQWGSIDRWHRCSYRGATVAATADGYCFTGALSVRGDGAGQHQIRFTGH